MQFDKAVEVGEDLWVARNAGLPICVDPPLEICMCLLDSLRGRGCVVVMIRVRGEVIEVGGVRRFALFSQETEVSEDIVLGMRPNPGAAG